MYYPKFFQTFSLTNFVSVVLIFIMKQVIERIFIMSINGWWWLSF